ncbi:hypothetical protein [Ohtaekwangia koreensis]|uniref:YhhN-like protein n=1 Tax=Ohtaekwangia koreensis TaxID=688867 RepID=A0A1T5MAE8_9BACT|nr:hypothetical protein [Ohtaekwangia koreensis]SKC85145.1 hypothetical protein SAMN05660236_4834 [Ohtaekwangia koreensis]
MTLETYIGVRNISSYSVLLPLALFAIAVYKRKQPGSVWLLGVLLIVSGLADLVSFLIYTRYHINPNPVVSVYGLLQFLILMFIYRTEYTRIAFKRLADVVSIAFIIFAAINFVYIQGVHGLNTNLFTVSSIVLMIFCLIYFYQIIQELPEPYIERMVMFWVGAGVFFYFGTNLFLFLTVDRFIPKADENFLLSWALHNGSNMVKNIIFSIAFYVALTKESGSPNGGSKHH